MEGITMSLKLMTSKINACIWSSKPATLNAPNTQGHFVACSFDMGADQKLQINFGGL